MCLGPPCYGYALNCHLVYLAIPGTRLLCMKMQNVFVLINATAKSEIQSCSNKHEAGFVYLKELFESLILVLNSKRLLNVIKEWDTTWLVVNPITIDSYVFLINYTTVGQASDLMTALTLSFNSLVGD